MATELKPLAEHALGFEAPALHLVGDEVAIGGIDVSGRKEQFVVELWNWRSGLTERLTLPATSVPAEIDSNAYARLSEKTMLVFVDYHSAYAPLEQALLVLDRASGTWRTHAVYADHGFGESLDDDVMAIGDASAISVIRISDGAVLHQVPVSFRADAVAINSERGHLAVVRDRKEVVLLRLDGSIAVRWPVERPWSLRFAPDDLAVWALSRSGIYLLQLDGVVHQVTNVPWQALDLERRRALGAGNEVAQLDLTTGERRVLGTLNAQPRGMPSFDVSNGRLAVAVDETVRVFQL
ncbi:MAG: hypothetical protein QM817_13000 [Archangium sp.]